MQQLLQMEIGSLNQLRHTAGCEEDEVHVTEMVQRIRYAIIM